MIDKILDVGHVRSTTGAFWFYVLSVVMLVGISTTLLHVLSMVGVVDGVGVELVLEHEREVLLR